MAKLSKNLMESRPKAIKLMNKNIKYNPVKQFNNTSPVECLKSKNGIIIERFKSKNGIINTKTTYSADTMYCCTIDALIQTLDATIQEFFSKYPDFFER